MTRQLRRHLVATAKGDRRCPEAGRLVWGWFIALSNARSYHMAGPNPISFADIEAFARLHRWPIQPRHVNLIRVMDEAWIGKQMERMQQPADGKKVIPQSVGDITPDLFDAVWG